MNHIGVVEVARAAPPPRKTESVQTQKGDDDFKKFLEACSQEDEQKKAAEMPEDAAAVMMLPAAPVHVEVVQADIPVAEVESAPVATAPVVMEDAPAQVEAQAKVEAAEVPVQTAAPVKAEAKVEAPAFAEELKTADAKPMAEAPAPAPKVEAAPVKAAQVETPKVSQAPQAEVAVEEQPTVKPVKVETVKTEPVAVAAESIPARVAVDVSAAKVETRPFELVRQMSNEITGMVTAGKNSLHIQIQPENMGRIDVHLVSNADGMKVVMTTDSAATGKMLENNLGQLQKSLSEAGLQISGLSVNNQGLQGQFANSFRDQATALPHSYQKQATIAAVPVEAIASRYSNPLSGFDFRV